MSQKYKNDDIGTRMKEYEGVASRKFMRRTPLIIRLDGKAFHTYLRPLKQRVKTEPWDGDYHQTMVQTTQYLANNIQNVVAAYSQSDEITLLLTDWQELTSQQWFGGKQSKIESVAASMATGAFNKYAQSTGLANHTNHDFAMFDARAFNIPKEDVCNNFIWRQQDAARNSVQMLGHFHFSNKQMHGKNNSAIQDMLMLERSINWNHIETWKKRGFCVMRNTETVDEHTTTLIPGFTIDEEIPIFTKDRNYIEKYLG